MKKIFFLIVFALIAITVHAQTCTAVANGNWNSAATWDCGIVPNGTITTVIIPSGVTVTIAANATYTGQVLVSGTLSFGINRRLTMGAGSVVQILSGGLISAFFGRIIVNGVTTFISPLFGTSPIPGPASIDQTGLPIELIYFDAAKVDEYASLSWATASEENFDYFEIQRAIGSIDFESIGEIKGAGADSYSIQEYAFVDEKPLNGINYYRLKAIDLDGTFEYSPIQSLKFDFEERFEVYPNPTAGLEMNILIDDVESHYTYVVYDNMGLLVDQGQILGGDETYTLPNLKPGLYHVKLIGRGDNPVSNLVVH